MEPDLWKIIVFQVIVFIGVAPMIMMSWMLAPKAKNPLKGAAFECGQVPIGDARNRFVMQYYAYLLMFVVLDVLAMFLYAWGLALPGVGTNGVIALILFIAILTPPLGYALHVSGKRELW